MLHKLFLASALAISLLTGCLDAPPAATASRANTPVTSTQTRLPNTPPTPTQTRQPTAKATATLAPTSTIAPAQPEPLVTATAVPLATATPTWLWPAASLLFRRDGLLQQWQPGSDTIRIVTEDVARVVYGGDVAVFIRELATGETALVVAHIPSGTEVELFRAAATAPDSLAFEVTISPTGRWLAYLAGTTLSETTLVVREIQPSGPSLTVTDPLLTITPATNWRWPYGRLQWATDNELSWSDEAGIWLADLAIEPIAPAIAIQPSTNTFSYHSPNPANADSGPGDKLTRFIPLQWSPDGRFLLVQEYYDEYGELRIIERGSNRLVPVPDSAIGAVSDGAIWLDATTLVHYQTAGTVQLWQIELASDPLTLQQRTLPAIPVGYVDRLWLFEHHLRFIAFGTLYDLDLDTGTLAELAQKVDLPLIWTQDGQYVLWQDSQFRDGVSQRHVFLSDLKHDPVLLDVLIGADSCCWHWYEP